jgi:hypothetical protein
MLALLCGASRVAAELLLCYAAVMNKAVGSLILILLALGLALNSGSAWGSEGPRPSAAPSSTSDDWDDDVWSDWGATPPDPNDLGDPSKSKPEDFAAPGSPQAPAPSFGGETPAGGIHFRLVRRGEEGPQGVRKHRPDYSRRSL